MAEDVNTPAAESSPAAPSTTESTPAAVAVPTDPEEYAEWRQSGKLPAEKKQPSEDDSAPSKSAGEKPGKDAPVSDTGNQRRQNRTDADTRKEELNREIRDLLKQRDTLRLEVGKKDVKADPSPAAEPVKKDDRPVRPKQEDFDDWAAYEAAQDKYLEDLADYKAAKRLEEHLAKQQQETLAQDMRRRLDSAAERYGKESEATITGTASTVMGDESVPPAIKAAIGRSEVIVDALYVLGSDADELAGFVQLAKTDPLEALRKWFTVEALVKEELKSGGSGDKPPRGTDGKFVADKGNEKPVKREAPSPTVEVNGNTAPTGDERERAAKAGDFRAFAREGNRRDVQRLRGN